MDVIFLGAIETFLAPRPPFDFQLEALEVAIASEGFEGKIECVLINVGKGTDAHADGDDAAAGMAFCLGLDAFENGRSDANLVHGINPKQMRGSWSLASISTIRVTRWSAAPAHFWGELMPPGVSDQDLRKGSYLHGETRGLDRYETGRPRRYQLGRLFQWA